MCMKSLTTRNAAYYQDQRSPAILDVDPKRPLPGITFIGLPDGSKKSSPKGQDRCRTGQIRAGARKSSARIPLSVSWSNRTELVDKPVWRAQVGLPYDFDALFAKWMTETLRHHKNQRSEGQRADRRLGERRWSSDETLSKNGLSQHSCSRRNSRTSPSRSASVMPRAFSITT